MGGFSLNFDLAATGRIDRAPKRDGWRRARRLRGLGVAPGLQPGELFWGQAASLADTEDGAYFRCLIGTQMMPVERQGSLVVAIDGDCTEAKAFLGG